MHPFQGNWPHGAKELDQVRIGTTANAADPLHIVSAGGQHHAEVHAFLLAYDRTDQGKALSSPLTPHRLYLAQSFLAEYVIDEVPDLALLFAGGAQVHTDPLSLLRIPLTKMVQVRMCSNSVPPAVV